MEISNRPRWRFCSKVPNESKLFSKPRWWKIAIRPLAKFKMPTGKRDEAWLSKATLVRRTLANLWRKLREDLIVIWKEAGHLEANIAVESNARSIRNDSADFAANSRRWTDHEPLLLEPTIDNGGFDDEPTIGALEDSSSQDDSPAKEKEVTTESFRAMSIQGSDQSSATYRKPAPVLAGVKTLRDQEKSQPRPRNTMTKKSLNVIRLMFPSGP